jgi:hypothetical protein
MLLTQKTAFRVIIPLNSCLSATDAAPKLFTPRREPVISAIVYQITAILRPTKLYAGTEKAGTAAMFVIRGPSIEKQPR